MNPEADVLDGPIHESLAFPYGLDHSNLFPSYNSKKVQFRGLRKTEQERIERENLRIASKLQSLKPHISFTDQVQGYEKRKKIAIGLQKIVKKRNELN